MKSNGDLWSDLVGGKYTRDVLKALQGSDTHQLGFNELKVAIEISSKTLSRTLRVMCKHRLLIRHEKNKPYRVHYELTKDGLALLEIIRQVEAWDKSRTKV